MQGEGGPSSSDLPLLSQEFAASSVQLLNSLRDCRAILSGYSGRAILDGSEQYSQSLSPLQDYRSCESTVSFGDGNGLWPQRQVLNTSSPDQRILASPSELRENFTQTTPRNFSYEKYDANTIRALQENETQTSPRSSFLQEITPMTSLMPASHLHDPRSESIQSGQHQISTTSPHLNQRVDVDDQAEIEFRPQTNGSRHENCYTISEEPGPRESGLAEMDAPFVPMTTLSLLHSSQESNSNSQTDAPAAVGFQALDSMQIHRQRNCPLSSDNDSITLERQGNCASMTISYPDSVLQRRGSESESSSGTRTRCSTFASTLADFSGRDEDFRFANTASISSDSDENSDSFLESRRRSSNYRNVSSASSMKLRRDSRVPFTRLSLGALIGADDLEPLMCEVEYPLMHDRPVLFVTNLPKDLDYSSVEPFEAGYEELESINDIFGGQFKKSIKAAFCESSTKGRSSTSRQQHIFWWKVIFKDISDARLAMRAHMRQKLERHRNAVIEKQIEEKRFPKVTFTSPVSKSRRRSDIFITNFERDDGDELVDFLYDASFGVRPYEVARFAADFDPKKPNTKNLCWRATYHTEEDAKLALALFSLQSTERSTSLECQLSYLPNPYTKGLVICYRSPDIPVVAIQKLKYYTPEGENIVEEVRYAQHNIVEPKNGERIETGDIFYDEESAPKIDGLLYARIITQNWWYTSLFWSLVYACLALMDLYSNIILSAQLFSEKSSHKYRYNFVLSFVGLQLFLFSRCWKETTEVITIGTQNSGDLIEAKTTMDRILLYSAAFTFSFVQVPGMVKNIVKSLHPWTNAQAKSAQKQIGARTFLVTYLNAHMYRVSDGAGFYKLFPPMMLSRFVLTVFKVVNAYWTRSSVLLFLSFAGVVLWPLQLSTFRLLIQDRFQLVDFIKKEAKELNLHVDSLKGLDDRKDYLSSKQKAVHTMWKKNFGDFNDLHEYSKLWDALPWDFWLIVIFLVVANVAIGLTQHYIMKLHSSGPYGGSGVAIRTLLDNVVAADVNSDRSLSLNELASAHISGRELMRLLQDSMADL